MIAKFCPLLFAGAATVVAVNRDVDAPEGIPDDEMTDDAADYCGCKGSGCMMWRVLEVHPVSLGYCGLASAPRRGEPDPQGGGK